MAIRKRKVHFAWMSAYWSCTPEKWQYLQNCVENNHPFDFDGCTELRVRPRSFHVFRDIEQRRQENCYVS